MKYKYELNWWDHYDQDRWITSYIISAFVVLFAFFVLKSINIPKLPKKMLPPEDLVFYEEPVQKKIMPKQIQRQQQPVQQEIFEKDPEIIIPVPAPPEPTTNLPQNMPSSDNFQVFENQSQDMPQSMPEMQLADGEMVPAEDDAPLEIPTGFESEWTQENAITKITTKHGDQSNVDVSSGISTTIRMEQKNNKVQFSGFRGEIDWSEILDPLLGWIGKNNMDIGLIPRKKLTRKDKTMKTTRKNLIIDGKKFEILLASKESRRQVTICMIDKNTNEYVLLVDQGLTKTSSLFELGTIERDKNGQVVRFKYSQKSANSDIAKKRMAQFWGWAKTLH
ncbi:MAG: hypothetical protein GXO74_01165 [Calditrichaeota bacterium]|nr:hypothetical protein [Calditrichota bacterium]